jgi:uncharacterized membrane protein YkvA (DUF1232 family)
MSWQLKGARVERIDSKNVDRYRDHFSRGRFHKKISKLPRKTGRKILDRALILYVLLTESDAPWWVRTSIVGVLGYLITPADCIPDFLPLGLADDLALMGLLLAELHLYTTPEVKQRAEELRPVK